MYTTPAQKPRCKDGVFYWPYGPISGQTTNPVNTVAIKILSYKFSKKTGLLNLIFSLVKDPSTQYTGTLNVFKKGFKKVLISSKRQKTLEKALRKSQNIKELKPFFEKEKTPVAFPTRGKDTPYVIVLGLREGRVLLASADVEIGEDGELYACSSSKVWLVSFEYLKQSLTKRKNTRSIEKICKNFLTRFKRHNLPLSHVFFAFECESLQFRGLVTQLIHRLHRAILNIPEEGNLCLHHLNENKQHIAPTLQRVIEKHYPNPKGPEKKLFAYLVLFVEYHSIKCPYDFINRRRLEKEDTQVGKEKVRNVFRKSILQKIIKGEICKSSDFSKEVHKDFVFDVLHYYLLKANLQSSSTKTLFLNAQKTFFPSESLYHRHMEKIALFDQFPQANSICIDAVGAFLKGTGISPSLKEEKEGKYQKQQGFVNKRVSSFKTQVSELCTGFLQTFYEEGYFAKCVPVEETQLTAQGKEENKVIVDLIFNFVSTIFRTMQLETTSSLSTICRSKKEFGLIFANKLRTFFRRGIPTPDQELLAHLQFMADRYALEYIIALYSLKHLQKSIDGNQNPIRKNLIVDICKDEDCKKLRFCKEIVSELLVGCFLHQELDEKEIKELLSTITSFFQSATEGKKQDPKSELLRIFEKKCKLYAKHDLDCQERFGQMAQFLQQYLFKK